MADDEKVLDMENRDPNNLNDHVKVAFEEVFGEPDGAHSHPCVWNLSYKCYNGGKNICYMILTFLCAAPVALCWGCEFACVTFQHIWEITPCLILLNINCGVFQRLLGILLGCCLAPICETIGLVFSKIHVENK